MTQLCQTFMITLWIVNRYEKHFLRIWNIVSLLQWPLTQLAYCQSSKYPPSARMQAWRRALHQLRYQLYSVEGHAKIHSSTSWTRDWYTRCWTIRFFKFLKNLKMMELTALSSRKGRATGTFLNFHVSHGSATRFLANVNSCSCSLYVVVRPSVCLSSVTFVHPTQAIEIFGNVSAPCNTLVTWQHPGKILWRSSQGNPSVEGLNQRVVEKCSDFWPLRRYISETVQDRR